MPNHARKPQNSQGSREAFLGPCSEFTDQKIIEHALGEVPDTAVLKERASLLHLPKGIKGENIIEIVPEEGDHHLLIVAEEGATAEIILTLRGKNISHSTEVVLAEDAKLDIVSLQSANPDATVEITQHSRLGSGASIAWREITLGGKSVKHDLVSEVKGEGGRSSVDWIFLARGTEEQHLSACNIFDGKDGGGEITVHGVAEGKAHVAFEGKIEITERGMGTNTYLTERTLMLDPTCKVDAIPALEIRTNDVKASHSATISKVSGEDLFYFGARGIEDADARRMIIEGFLGTLTQRFPQRIQELILKKIQSKLETSP